MINLNSSDKKRAERGYKDLKQYYLKKGQKPLDYEDKPYTNFLDIIYPVVKKIEYYSNDMFMYAVERYLQIDKTDGYDIDKLFEYIEKHFEINKDKHFLIFPLQGSGLVEDIYFSEFYFLTQKEEEIIIKQIAEITKIEYARVKEFLDHTRNSRSRDFLKSNLMIIKVENQTENVDRFAYQMAQFSVDILKLIHAGFGMETSIFRMAEEGTKKNSHVAILAKDDWRCGFGFSWNAELRCKIDIDFMSEKKYQDIFKLLFLTSMKKNSDELTSRFVNALMLYGKAKIQQSNYSDVDLALLLYLTVLESLFTEGKNEKRLRLSAIVPRLIEYEGKSISEISKGLNSLYMSRNNFLHAGRTTYFTRNDEEIEFLERVTALVIIKCFTLEKEISSNGEKRIDVWSKYVDKIFNDLIMGVES